MNQKEIINEEINEIFTLVQRTSAVHQKNAILLKEYYEHDSGTFVDCIKNILNNILVTPKPSIYLERIMDFFGQFCALLRPESNDDETEYADNPLLTEIFSYLLEASSLVNDTIRVRSCQLINQMFIKLVGVDLSQNLCKKIETDLFTRFQDPKSAVRQQVVITLHWLQDPTNPQDVIIPEFLNLMNSDSSAKVRQLCVEKIALRKDVIVSFINRICDVDVNVKLAAYKRLSDLAGFLKISEKRTILQCGVLDPSEEIKKFVNNNLLRSWLNHYEGNILIFMKSIRLDADENDLKQTTELFENILNIIFDEKSLKELSAFVNVNERKLIPVENLDWEVASYWRIYVQYLCKKEEFEEELSKILPEPVYFCEYVKEFYVSMPKEVTSVDFLEQQYLLKQFFLIIKTYDFSDPTSRQCLNALVCNILENTVLTSEVTELVISCLECSIPNISERTEFVCGIISEILYPLKSDENEIQQKEKDYQISQIFVKLERLKSEQDDCIALHHFLEAERLKGEINELELALVKLREDLPTQHKLEKKTDTPTTIKCLDIAAGMLLSPQVTRLTIPLKALKEDFINELLIGENFTVRMKALRCYALYCIIDKESSSNGIHIFSTPIFAYQNGQECDSEVLKICIGAVVDLLRLYGSELLAATENEELSESMSEKHKVVFTGGTALTDVLQGIVELMDDEQYTIQETAALGLCKLVVSQRIISASLIARLILKWSNPVTGDEFERIRQIIAYTLQIIPIIPEYSEALKEAILITIKALYSAPRISPLADVNIENVTKFMLALCRSSKDAEYIKSNLATTICEEMRNKPKNKINTIYSKIILLLDIPGNIILITDLLKLCDQIRDNISEGPIFNNIVKFTTLLKNRKIQDQIIQEDDGDDMEENENF